ncbi:MAG TPA: hypothetical protein VLQ48_10140 [Chloroflexia bacterium]|nr:hypothetical protein [Chloroflexia bacterium]
MDGQLVEIWRKLVSDPQKSWVLFEHGTCVVLPQPGADLAAQATALLAEWGPVHVGTDSADFNLFEVDTGPGWVVTCHHPDILVYVAADKTHTLPSSDIVIGLLGRSNRDQDAHELKVAHVEDRRP